MAIPVENGDMGEEDELDLTFSQLCSYLESSETSLEFAIKTRLLPPRTGMDCSHCQATRSVVWMKRLSQSTVPFILFCKSCRKTISLCRNTALSGTGTNVKQFYQCTYCWLLGLTVKEGAAQSGVSSEISQTIYALNQEVCYVMLSQGSKVLGGPDLTVEIGDLLLSRRKHINRPGQKVKTIIHKDSVYIGYCIETKETFVLKVERSDLNTLLELIMIMVLPGSKIIIDSCHKYSEFVVENYDISFHANSLGNPDKIEPKRLKFTDPLPSRCDPALYLIQQLYFRRWTSRETASQRFYPFVEELVQVYPGYGRNPIRPLTLHEFSLKT